MSRDIAEARRRLDIKSGARAVAECVHKGLQDKRSREHYTVEAIAELIEAQVAAALEAAEGPAVALSCDCYDGVILGPRYDVDINDVTTCPKCSGAGAQP